ncbi:hypothetical protein QBC37DRAFT_372144 [Rhypophila decipiens]|uniref:Uncharacterized protein n=1 Tax=Rhypophila decipiens TaxID=261697 RepID=A0AAN6YB50_9PEZI|nr:hypothetical protein QBC37DRAFT_372144 [Rhypophila decipiens]
MCFIPDVMYVCEDGQQPISVGDGHPPTRSDRDYYTKVVRYCDEFDETRGHGSCEYMARDEEVSLGYPLVCEFCRRQLFRDMDNEFNRFLDEDLNPLAASETFKQVARDAWETFFQELKTEILEASEALKEEWKALLDSVEPTRETPRFGEVEPLDYTYFVRWMHLCRQEFRNLLQDRHLLSPTSRDHLLTMLENENNLNQRQCVSRMIELLRRQPFPRASNGISHR